MNFKKIKSNQVVENKKNHIIYQDKHKKGRGFEPKGSKDYYIENAHIKKKFQVPQTAQGSKNGQFEPLKLHKNDPLMYTNKIRNVTSPDKNNGQT